ncbi:MAG TPA: DNA alkylation repair protein [Candidatus Limnocylindrales bacterium]|nr:DNA alkylation repair protein [Candidatus Limnocylindrales bacterium]
MPKRANRNQAPARVAFAGIVRELGAAADPKRAAVSRWFFKTGKGQYGEGDRFLGISTPDLRRIALRYRNLRLKDVERLLRSPIHEHRSAGFEILVAQYSRGESDQREKIFRFYLGHTRCANNWDLVDGSAPYIVGEHLKTKPRAVLDKLAESKLVWERRIAIVATVALIREGELEDTFRIAEKLLSDQHDLIHKAVGWMLRETGKISDTRLRKFLQRHYERIPRTTLRYAIERFPAPERRRLLAGIF